MTSAMYDALVLLSFGGPEGHEDVRPFLENVTRGRGIPPERLDEVEVHYHHFGGVSPLNDLNREIIHNVEQELRTQKVKLKVYFANRNWHPMAGDTAIQMAKDGVRNALVFATSAWAGYSGCRQYDEDIVNMREAVSQAGLPEITFTKLRHFYDHPLYIAAMTDAVMESRKKLPKHARHDAQLVFTAHSIPLVADMASGIQENLYSRQVREAARLVAQAAGFDHWDVVWQSRSGDPRVPWLEPDIVDHIVDVHKRGVRAAIVCPIGFVSDHIEVVWDLDSELAEEAKLLRMPIERTRTAGPTPEFAQMVVELVREHISGAPARRLGEEPSRGCTVNGAPCASDCCVSAKPGALSRPVKIH